MRNHIQCSEKNRSALVERYVLGGMRKKEKNAFEAHLHDCEACSKHLQESQKIVDRLKNAAQSAGWTESQVAQIDQLYSRGDLLQNINWRFTMRIAIILVLVVIVPFIWWANRSETKLALLVSLERETGLLDGETDQTGILQGVLGLHQNGDDEAVITSLREKGSLIESLNEKATAERLSGLSYLFIDEPDSALAHLYNALINCGPEAEQLAFVYIAKAHLLIGNKVGALSALRKAAQIQASFKSEALELIEKLGRL